jgi:hypothetical protein
MVYTFSRPVSLPSFWLTTYNGNGSPVNINVYSDTGGSTLLGTVSFNTATHAGPGSYAWLQCTNLNGPAYNGMIRRVEFSVVNQNPQLDDMAVVVNTNAGALQNITLSLPTTNLFGGMSRQATVIANYQFISNVDVTMGSGVVYTSSNTNVITVTANGLVQAVGAGTGSVMATLQSQTSSLAVAVAPGTIIDFNAGLPSGLDFTAIPSSYQPVPGLTIGYANVGLFSGGPDDTTGVAGGNHYNTYAASGDNGVMVYTFSRPVSLPSFWLTTYNGNGSPVNINVYSDTGGSTLLGTVSFNTATHAGPGSYAWLQCTNLNGPAYNGMIRRVEFSVVNQNPQLDDMVVVLGSLALLSTTFSNNQMVISWPTSSSAGAILMQSPGIGPGAIWTPASGTPGVVGGNYQMTLPVSGPTEFFRLQY